MPGQPKNRQKNIQTSGGIIMDNPVLCTALRSTTRKPGRADANNLPSSVELDARGSGDLAPLVDLASD